jgi:PPOX class probable F420-dependent enzyme
MDRDHSAASLRFDTSLPAARLDRMLRTETVIWLSTVRADGQPHLVPIWFSWDGETILVASKPNAKKVANLRLNPSVMVALGEPDDDFDVGMLEGVAELPSEPSAELLPLAHLQKYRTQMASIGLTPAEFLRTYTQVIRIRPTRFLPWHGRTEPKSERGGAALPLDRRIAAAVRRVAVGSRPRVAVALAGV